MFDKNQSGTIDEYELRACLRRLLPMQYRGQVHQLAERVLREADWNHDRRLSWAEFRRCALKDDLVRWIEQLVLSFETAMAQATGSGGSGFGGGGYAPQATAAVDTTGDGRANALVRGVDRNGDGIPDALQGGGMMGGGMMGGGMMGNEMGTLQASLQMLNGAIESLSQSVSSPNHCQTQLVGAGHLNNPRLRRCVLPSAIGLP